MSDQDDKAPFAAHRRYYLAIKLAVLAVALLLALAYVASIQFTI